MAEILVLGAGLNGLTLAMLLACDGHAVTVLERDPAPPPADPRDAWEAWERRGVNQFRLPHLMLARWTSQMAVELPKVLEALEAHGAPRINLVARLPIERTGGWRDGDEVHDTVTARRPVLEAVVASAAAATPGVEIRRGVAVTGLVTATGDERATPAVTGVLTDGGETLRADLVVDTTGRRSSLPTWLRALGAPAPEEEREDSGFVYYCRHFRSRDGGVPDTVTQTLTPFDSLSILTLPADNATWGVAFITSAHDRELRVLRDPAVWERTLRAYPGQGHWADGEPIDDGVAVMAGIEDRRRRYVIGGRPVATGVVAVGDSWACTNPSLGRGSSIGLLHARLLRDVLREVDPDDRETLVLRFDEVTRREVDPYYDATLRFDRHRLAEIEAEIDGRTYETDDPSWAISKALSAGAATDPDLVRVLGLIAGLQALPEEALARPGVFDRVLEVGAGARGHPYPGPSRVELLGMLARR